jgi:hypothetical protein
VEHVAPFDWALTGFSRGTSNLAPEP